MLGDMNPVEYLLRKLGKRDELEEWEKEIVRESPVAERSFAARETIIRGGQPLDTSLLLLDGFVCRYQDLLDGRRVILEIHVPGDFIDLQGFLLKRLEHNLAALSPSRVALVPHERLKTISENWAHLTRMLWFTSLIDAAVHRQWIVSNARRSALGRIAHLFCELQVRLEITGLGTADGFNLPVTQGDIADATGLTAIHVNRMLKELRDAGLMTFREGRATIGNLAGLRRVGEFDPAYLFLDRQPR